MTDVLVYPDTLAAVASLVDGMETPQGTVTAGYRLTVDSYGAATGPFPYALLYRAGGKEGYVDRVDSISVEVYASAGDAVEVAETIRALIDGTDVDTAKGYLDAVSCQSVPVLTPYQSDTLDKAVATYNVTVRPID